MSNTKRTQLYHSELCTLCNGAWLQITVTSDVLRSKFNKPGEDKHYCEMTVGGVPRSYFVENPACGNALRGRKNQTIFILASGSRDDAAIDLDPNAPPASAAPPQQPPPAGNPPPPTQRQPPPPAPAPTAAPAPAAAAPPANTRGGKQFVWDTLGQLTNLFLMCENRILEMPGFDDLTDPDIANVVEKRITTLFIQSARMGLEQHLPMKLMQPKPNTTAPGAQAHTPPPAPTPPPPAASEQPPPHEEDEVPF